MLVRCSELHEPIKAFQRKYRQTTKSEKEFHTEDDSDGFHYNSILDALFEDDWLEFYDLIAFLKVPYVLCKALEGSNSVSGFDSLWRTIINLQALWQHSNAAANSFDDNDESYFKSAINYGLEKLNTYWETFIMEPTPSFYTIATALHPRLRPNWFKSYWRDYRDWQRKADSSFRNTFGEYLAAEALSDEMQHEKQPRKRKLPASYTNSPLASVMEIDQEYYHGSHDHKRYKRSSRLDEYIDNLNEDLNKEEAYQELMADPWLWWLKVSRSEYPILFKMAIDFLSILCTSCECERCFSTASRTIIDDRKNLSASTIEAIQLQKNWLKNRVMKSPAIKRSSQIERKDREQRAEETVSPEFDSL